MVRQGTRRSWPRNVRTALVAGGALGLIVAVMAACGSSNGPSESYLWGEKAGNSAVSLVHAGVEPGKACDGMLEAGAIWADNPALNPTPPPPKNFNRDDAKEGCLQQLHKRLGY